MRIEFLCALLAIGCSAPSVQAPLSVPGPPPPAGPLAELNLLFREAYRERRVQIEEMASPVIVASGNDLVLHRGGATETVRVIPEIFHDLKAVAHLPFTLYLRLQPFADRPGELPPATLQWLGEIQPRIAAARTALGGLGLSPQQVYRQAEIFDACDELIGEALRHQRISAAELGGFTHRMGPLMLANADEAACAQVAGTHRQVMAWKQAMSCAEWEALRVVNRGRHQSRYRSAATQYFGWLLGEPGAEWSYPGESMKVVYGESLGKDEDALDLLGIVLLDAEAGDAFFQDPWRMSEDILSRGTQQCIRQLPATDRGCRGSDPGGSGARPLE